MVSKFNLLFFFLWAATRLVPSFFLLSMSMKWLRLLALYDYSICIMMSGTYCCSNLSPLFSSLCLTQHITEQGSRKPWWWTISLFSPGIPSPCPAVLVDVLFKGRFTQILVSSTVADWGQQLPEAALHGAEKSPCFGYSCCCLRGRIQTATKGS